MNYRNIKLIAFDFDGVLIDSLHHNIQITNAVCRKFGSIKDITAEDLQNIDQMSFENVAEFIGVPKDNFKPCLKLINQCLVDTYDTLLPFPGIESALQKLALCEIKLIIVTHNTQLAVDAFLRIKKLRAYFDMILGTETEGGKDEKLINAMSEFNIAPHESMMIGDSVSDIVSAIKADVFPVGVAWGFQKPEKLRDAGAAAILLKTDDIATVHQELL